MATGSGTGKESKRSPPLLLYRGDSRPPSAIFDEGFQARGGITGDTDVVTHVLGGENLKKSGLISTSQSLRIPPIFMKELLKDGELDQIIGNDGQKYTKRSGWVYHIKPTDNLEMVYVPDMLKDRMKAIYSYQQEWAVKWEIPGKNVKGAQRVEGYVRRDDLVDGRGPFLMSPAEVGSVFHEWLPNPKYLGAIN